MCGEAVPAAAVLGGLGHENPIARLLLRTRARGGDLGSFVQPLSSHPPAVHPGQVNPVKSPSCPALRQGSQLDGKLTPSSLRARVAFRVQYFTEPETSTHFPPLLQEQGRTDPNSSEPLWPFFCKAAGWYHLSQSTGQKRGLSRGAQAWGWAAGGTGPFLGVEGGKGPDTNL